jgi:heme exporter protein CcmD
MTHAAFIIPAYAVTVGGLLAILLQSWVSMRRAEAAAEKLKMERRR